MVQVVPGRREAPRIMALANPALDCPKAIVARLK
jgi:hypothetical protein